MLCVSVCVCVSVSVCPLKASNQLTDLHEAAYELSWRWNRPERDTLVFYSEL